jgi:hypothetical protein
MGGEENSTRDSEDSVVGESSYMAPDFEDIMEGLFPTECLTDSAKLFVKGYMRLRYAEFFLAGIGAGVAVFSAATDNWLPAILYVIFGALVAGLIDVGKKALREAIDSEGERYEETTHYRELSQSLCLREREKGKSDDGGGDS